MNRFGEMNETRTDLAQVLRLALAEQAEDVRMFAARLVRKYRATDPDLAEQLNLYLRNKAPRSGGLLRRATPPVVPTQAPPVDDESRMTALASFTDEQLLFELVRRAGFRRAPKRVEYCGKGWMETTIGIGADDSASVYMDADGLAALAERVAMEA